MGGTLSDAFLNVPIPLPENSLESGCSGVWNIGTVIIESFDLVGTYFTSRTTTRQNVERDVLSSLPTFGSRYRDPDANNKPRVDPRQNSAADGWARFIFETIGGLDGNYVRDVIDAIPDVVKRLIRCDINSVMFCSEFRYSLFSSAVIVAILLYIGGVVLASLGVPYVWTALALVYSPIVLFYSLGYSPLCAPMVPTCIGDEIITTFDLLLPARVNWPQPLQHSPNCIDNVNITASECIVSCSAHPFNFRGWCEGAAWTVCELNVDACIALHNWLRTQSFASTPDAILFDLSSALWRSHMILTQADADMVSAYRLCTVFTSWRLVPLILLAVVVIFTIPVLVSMPIHLIISCFQVSMTALGMSHTHVRQT
jgi:hypothetical protein